MKLLGASASYGFVFSSFILLPKFMVEQLGAGPTEVGLAAGAFGLAAVGSIPLLWQCIDHRPRRYCVAAAGALMAVAALGFVAVDRVGPYLYALRMIQGLAFALAFTAVPTLGAQLAPASRLSQAVGICGAAMLATNAVAPAIAERLALSTGWQAVFVLAAIAGALCVWLACAIDETPHALRAPEGGGQEGRLGQSDSAHTAGAADGKVPQPASASQHRGLSEQPSVASSKESRRYAVILTLSGIASGAIFNFLAPYSLELGRADVSGFFVAYAVAATVMRVAFGDWPDRFGRRRVAVLALLLYSATVFAAGGIDPAQLELLGFVFGIAHGIYHPAIISLALGRTPSAARGRVMVVIAGAFNTGTWCGGPLLGHIAATAGYPACFTTAALCALAAALVLGRSSLLLH